MHPWVMAEREGYLERYHELVEGLDLSKPISVLDYGAGTGGFAGLLAEYNPHIRVTAVDSNPQAIELGRDHYKHLPNLEFMVSDKIPEGKWNIIFKNLVLHELNEKGDRKTIVPSLKRAYKYLKDGGLISIFDNRQVSREEFKPVYDRNKSRRKGTFDEEYDEHNKYTMKDWGDMLKKVGFKTEKHSELHPNLFLYRGRK